MGPLCSLCSENESKYRCKNCSIRYCSVKCFKTHNIVHTETPPVHSVKSVSVSSVEHRQEQPEQRPHVNRNQRIKKRYATFKNDNNLKALLTRYPALKAQLQLIYAITLQPGQQESPIWGRRNWYDKSSDLHAQTHIWTRTRDTNLWRDGLPPTAMVSIEDKIRGEWTESKGNEQAMTIIRNMRVSAVDEHAEGIDEFIQLAQMKLRDSS